ncbi:MAG: hypothetical protein GX491_02910 [Chloroflexi bacterium]|nr:hypothetical protein [Chloroflexota bacterium]
MPLRRSTMITRTALSLVLIAVLSLSFPTSALAAPELAVLVKFDIVETVAHESVTIRTVDFPIRTNFVVRIGEAKKQGVDGIIVAEFNSGAGGEIEATYQLPEEYKDTRILGIRIESADGYYGYNWFFNNTRRLIPDENRQPELVFSGVKKNQSATIEAKNLPARTKFTVRAGPYDRFYSAYVTLDPVQTGLDGSVKFDLQLPEALKDVENITVRLDGAGKYVVDTFKNADGGGKVPQNELVQYTPCQVIMVSPVPALEPRADFDAWWVIQNTGYRDWQEHTVDYSFAGGVKMHKREDVRDLWYVRRGQTATIVIDMLAPETPGYHTTTWKVTQGDNTLCTLSLTVFVKG